MGFKDGCHKFVGFVRGIFSEPDGMPSSTRVLMFVFSGFTLWLLWRIFWHVFHLTDTTQITIWLSNIPLLITALMGLIALPYTINRGAGALSETFNGIANMMASSRQVQLNANIGNQATALLEKAQAMAGINPASTPPPSPPPANPQATGSSCPKG